MSFDLQSHYDEHLKELMDKVTELDINDPATLTAMKSVQIFSNSRPSLPEVPPTPEPTTLRGRAGRRIAAIWDNETTRVFIKAAGAFAGVGAITYATIHKDHVIERQALAQANQRID